MSNKLELTWFGKENVLQIEPRILIENAKLSNDEKSLDTENMIIHGDNLLALKALQNKYANEIKCIYIDPPYNAKSSQDDYDDNFEHSYWLSLMKQRLELMHSLLRKDGVLFISIDDDECHYLKVLCDEIFGRKNFAGSFVWERKKKPSYLSNMGVVTEYVLAYTKSIQDSPDFIYGTTTEGKRTPINNAGNGLAVLTFPPKSVKFKIPDGIVNAQDMSEEKIKTKLLNDVIIKDGYNENEFKLEGEWRYSQKKIDEILNAKEELVIAKIPFRPNHIKTGGKPKKMKNLLSIAHYNMSTNEDATAESRALFGADDFAYPKPEKLISVLIGAVTHENDIVLDSFLGSGTTAAVAHKMGRRYIGIEMGDQAYTHCKVRLDKVISGKDNGGISQEVNWNGGGGYKFYELAPSLIVVDDFGEQIINKTYNPEMLAAAVALHEGFSYQPNETQFWKQSIGTENSYLFVTTQFVTYEYIENIHNMMSEKEHLIIACKKFDSNCCKAFNNITLKKIPEMLLNRCKFSVDNYNFNIINPPSYNSLYGDNDDELIEGEDNE